MTKKQFMKRCEVMWDTGVFKNRKITNHISNALDAYLRLRHVINLENSPGQPPGVYGLRFLMQMHSDHQAKMALNSLCGHQYPVDFKLGCTLAGDEAYKAIQAMAILDHPCQKCAEDPNAWHTRPGFCTHKKKGTK
jgi:hypothetical protein